MKRTIPIALSLIVLSFAVVFGVHSARQPSNAADPCCSIVAMDAVNGVVTARDLKTGRTFEFKADKLDIRGMRIGDSVEADMESRSVLSISGVARQYQVNDLNPAAPCCSIVSIQPATPCCAIATARNKETGKTMQFKVEGETVKNSLKVGGPVYASPCCGEYAFVRVAGVSYSFPLQGSGKSDAMTERSDGPSLGGYVLTGEWESEVRGNVWRMRVSWNENEKQFEGALSKQGEISAQVGFTLGEVCWKARPTKNAYVLADQQKYRQGSNGVSTGSVWTPGLMDLRKSSPDHLVTSGASFHRVQ